MNALSYLELLIEIHPTDGEAYLIKGSINYELGNKAEACNNWKKASDLGNNDATEALKKYCN